TTVEGRWILNYFAPWLDKKHPRPAQPGELRWFATKDGVELEVEVHYAMEDEPAGMIRATLVPDPARPHGYAWTRFELPEPRADG
ncbi:MAG: terminase, partial [Planctomycetota bacterium]